LLRPLLPLLALLAPAAAIAQAATVAGRVTDAGGRPLAGASVAIQGSDLRTATDESGHYRLTVDRAGTVRIRASKRSYTASSHRVTAVAGATVSRDFRLFPTTAERDELPARGF
jgi:Carboxypeptidase regulatory-like domain